MNSLVKFWNECELLKPPFVHPEDQRVLGREREFSTRQLIGHREFVLSDRFGNDADKAFHLSLLPVPYIGNLDTSDIVVLMLNPGLGLSDYYTQEDAEHSRRLVENIRQDYKGVEYPFMFLDPNFAWSGGFMWWEKKLRKILHEVADSYFDGSYPKALRHLSQRMAAIELVPYHSRSFGAHRLLKRMPSAVAAKTFVEGVLVPKVRKGKVTLIATRQIGTLELPPRVPSIVVYGPSQARGAHLGPDTLGGEAILQAIKAKPPR
ncbi:MAG: hypothetical protein JWN71_5072 [Xanthobacteraceae bacterium]|nr:hypothetical protein [Xanthobacteraceae bacterium]